MLRFVRDKALQIVRLCTFGSDGGSVMTDYLELQLKAGSQYDALHCVA